MEFRRYYFSLIDVFEDRAGSGIAAVLLLATYDNVRADWLVMQQRSDPSICSSMSFN